MLYNCARYYYHLLIIKSNKLLENIHMDFMVNTHIYNTYYSILYHT
jgi:hypothetical protein